MTRFPWPLWAVAAAAVASCAAEALGHEAPSGWSYEAWCCSNQDCMPLPRHAVTMDRDGYHIRLAPGEHFMAPNGGQWTVPHRTGDRPNHRIREGGDEHYHACILPGSQTMQCIYRPMGGV